MKTLIISTLFIISLGLSAALAQSSQSPNCIKNELNEDICVGDTLFPWRQKVLDINHKDKLLILQEQGYVSQKYVGFWRVAPTEKHGYKLGQVITNAQLNLQVVEYSFPALLGGQTLPKVETTWRVLPQFTNVVDKALSNRAAKAFGYKRLFQKSVTATQVEFIEKALEGTGYSVKTYIFPFQIKIGGFDPNTRIIGTTVEIEGVDRHFPMTKQELDLYASSPADSFLNACREIEECGRNLTWGEP